MPAANIASTEAMFGAQVRDSQNLKAQVDARGPFWWAQKLEWKTYYVEIEANEQEETGSGNEGEDRQNGHEENDEDQESDDGLWVAQ